MHSHSVHLIIFPPFFMIDLSGDFQWHGWGFFSYSGACFFVFFSLSATALSRHMCLKTTITYYILHIQMFKYSWIFMLFLLVFNSLSDLYPVPILVNFNWLIFWFAFSYIFKAFRSKTVALNDPWKEIWLDYNNLRRKQLAALKSFGCIYLCYFRLVFSDRFVPQDGGRACLVFI